MPKRWLSRRGRPQNNDSSSHHTSNKNQNFDFAFSQSPHAGHSAVPAFPALPTSSKNDGRPTTAGGVVEGRYRKRLEIDIPLVRRRSSEGNRVSTYKPSHRASRSVDDLIGLAFGSPSHPPMAFGSLAAPLSPARPEHGYRLPEPPVSNGKVSHLQPKTWKKLGALFRSGLIRGKDSTTASPVLIQGEQTYTTSHYLSKGSHPMAKAQVPDQPTRYPPPIPSEVLPSNDSNVPHAGEIMLFEPTPPSSAELSGPARMLTARPTRMSSLPKLEVDVPNKPLGHYPVMVANIPAASKSSSLLARRSRAVESLVTSANSSRNASASTAEPSIPEAKADADVDGEMLQPRRMTSPTLPKPPFAMTRSESSPTTSKYSLFPPKVPTPIKIVGRVPSEGPLKRSATSPARLSPMQDRFPTTKSLPLSSNRNATGEKHLSSPEDTTASTDCTDPWSTNHSLQSSVSSSATVDEIFFDIKSFRNSKGLEDEQQYVINRPESAIVQLARTRSKANRGHKLGTDTMPTASQPTLSPLRNEILDKHASVSTVNSAVFDEVIAAVEEFATPMSAKKSGSTVANGISTHSSLAKATMSKADLDLKLLPPDPVLPFQSASVSRRDQVLRNIPSPVIEEVSPLSKKCVSSENAINARAVSPVSMIAGRARAISPKPASPATTKNNSPLKSKERNHVPAESPNQLELSKPVPFKRVDTPVEDSPTIPQGPPPRKPVHISQDNMPPPVPEKDSKFIPISKFAAKNTMSRVEQVGVRTARSNRSATDSIIRSPPLNQHKHSSPKIGVRAERSATIPMPQGQQSSTPSKHSKSDFAHRRKPNTEGKSETTAVAVVKPAAPAAEVSVARTVSLARKQSAKVLVPGPKLAARRAASRNGDNGGSDSGTDTPNTVLSAASSPITGTNSPQLPQEQLIPRIVELQLKEVSVPPNPLRSRPSPPSVVITDLPAVITTAGTATPATHVKSPAPPRPAPEDPDKSKAREKIKALKAKAREKIAKDAEIAEKRTSHLSDEANEASKDRDSKERQMIEKYKEKDKTKWEILERRAFSPIVMEEKRYGHKQGLSVGIVLDSA